MDKVQKFKTMMEKRYGNEFETVLNYLYDGDIVRMYQEFVLRKSCYPYPSYKQSLYRAYTQLKRLQNRKDEE